MWAHLQREGIPVARRTVERIMRVNGWRGVTRASRTPRTTEPGSGRRPGAGSDLTGRSTKASSRDRHVAHRADRLQPIPHPPTAVAVPIPLDAPVTSATVSRNSTPIVVAPLTESY